MRLRNLEIYIVFFLIYSDKREVGDASIVGIQFEADDFIAGWYRVHTSPGIRTTCRHKFFVQNQAVLVVETNTLIPLVGVVVYYHTDSTQYCSTINQVLYGISCTRCLEER